MDCIVVLYCLTQIYNWAVFLDVSSELYGYDKDLVLAKVLGRSCLSRLKLTQNFWPSETIRGIVQKSDKVIKKNIAQNHGDWAKIIRSVYSWEVLSALPRVGISFFQFSR